MRGKFTACIAYRAKHSYCICGFDEDLELCTCGAIKFFEQFLYIIMFYLNFVPNLHYKDVNVTLRYKFVYSSNQERCLLISVGGAHFSFRKNTWMGKMTTSVLICINIFLFGK